MIQNWTPQMNPGMQGMMNLGQGGQGQGRPDIMGILSALAMLQQRKKQQQQATLPGSSLMSLYGGAGQQMGQTGMASNPLSLYGMFSGNPGMEFGGMTGGMGGG
jgi:hypothetical protein